MGRGEGGDQLGRRHRRRGADEADLEDPPFGPGERFGGPPDLAFALDGRPGLLEEGLAGVGQGHPAGVAVEQLQSQFGLEL